MIYCGNDPFKKGLVFNFLPMIKLINSIIITISQQLLVMI